jgi:hypothetical protein
MALPIPRYFPSCPRCPDNLRYDSMSDTFQCATCGFLVSSSFLVRGTHHGNRSTTSPSHHSPAQAAHPFLPGTWQSIAVYQSLLAQQQASLAQQNAIAQQTANAGIANALGNLYPVSLFGYNLPEPKPPEPLESAGISVGEIIGYRVWQVKGGYLASYSTNHIWPPNEIMSGNPTDFNNEGIWSFKQLSRALNKMLEMPNLVVGSIKMWGTVIEHYDGYRAEFARVASIDDINMSPAKRWTDYLRSHSEKHYRLKILRHNYGLIK